MKTEKEKIREKSKEASGLFQDCMSRLKVIRKKQNEVIGKLYTDTDGRKINRIKDEIKSM